MNQSFSLPAGTLSNFLRFGLVFLITGLGISGCQKEEDSGPGTSKIVSLIDDGGAGEFTLDYANMKIEATEAWESGQNGGSKKPINDADLIKATVAKAISPFVFRIKGGKVNVFNTNSPDSTEVLVDVIDQQKVRLKFSSAYATYAGNYNNKVVFNGTTDGKSIQITGSVTAGELVCTFVSRYEERCEYLNRSVESKINTSVLWTN